VRRKEFREDLFYRLAVVHVHVPALADRREDILPLAEAFLRRTDGADAVIPEALARLLESYAWPGNARELRNVIERFSTFKRADAGLLFGGERPSGKGAIAVLIPEPLESLPYHEMKRRMMDAFHRAFVARAVERAHGSVPKAAELLGLPKTSVYRMLQNLEAESPDEP
jgi:DNA-binding NtrC family response regulator